MATAQDVLSWRGMNLADPTGAKIGTIEEIYEDTDTGVAEWALVNTGLFGTKSTFVPLREANAQGDGVSVTVPYEKSLVKDAPGMEREGELSRDEEQKLYRHYGLDYGTSRSDSGLPDAGSPGSADRGGTVGRDASTTDASGTVGRDTSGPTTDDAMTRSEEELQVGTESRESGRARLRKYVVTENVETTVPVTREEVRIEREPITDANRGDALSGPAISEEEHEVVLHEERPVVQKDVVPKERVRLDTETTTEEVRVSEEVRKEQVDTDGGDVGTGGRTRGDVDTDDVTNRDRERGDADNDDITRGTTSSNMGDAGSGKSPGVRDRESLGEDPDDVKNQAP